MAAEAEEQRPMAAQKLGKEQAILQAALGLFAQKGVESTAIPEIAAAAGVGVGTIYRYFDDKAALANGVFRMAKHGFARAVWQDLPPNLDRHHHFRVIFKRLAAFALAEPLAFRFLEMHHHQAYLDQQSQTVEAQALAPAFDFLAVCETEGLSVLQPRDLAVSLVWGGLVGLVKESWRGKFPLNGEILERAADGLWRGIILGEQR